ncbi:MAG: hypothetical protein LUG16_07250, partial [Candidatus Gastranaerophilales bacterium]|nr:hypothetical protein [Candidatus Gastranaerophilales bacterium]
NISFKGSFFIDSKELSKIPTLKKIQFLKQKNTLIDEFCKTETPIQKLQNGFLLNIKDEKENTFIEYLKQFKINSKKIE